MLRTATAFNADVTNKLLTRRNFDSVKGSNP